MHTFSIATRRHRALAYLYELLPVLALVFFFALLALPVTAAGWIAADGPIYQFWLLASPFAYFGYCWTHGGQTLAMRAWHLHVVTEDGHALSWRRAALRYVVALAGWACLGAGHLWALVDRQRRGWHDLAARTRVVRLEVS